jgi:hypothetical protein
MRTFVYSMLAISALACAGVFVYVAALEIIAWRRAPRVCGRCSGAGPRFYVRRLGWCVRCERAPETCPDDMVLRVNAPACVFFKHRPPPNKYGGPGCSFEVKGIK